MNITGIPREAVDAMADLATRAVDAFEILATNLAVTNIRLGSLHTDQQALIRAVHHLEDAIVANIEDFRAAQGGLAEAVGGLNTTVAALSGALDGALDRLDAMFANLSGALTTAQGQGVSDADVAAMQTEIASLREVATGLGGLSDKLQSVAQDPNNPIPDDAPPLDDTPAP